MFWGYPFHRNKQFLVLQFVKICRLSVSCEYINEKVPDCVLSLDSHWRSASVCMSCPLPTFAVYVIGSHHRGRRGLLGQVGSP